MPAKPYKTCDSYTPETRYLDYQRHRRNGEEPCMAARIAWRTRQRMVDRKRAAKRRRPPSLSAEVRSQRQDFTPEELL